MQVGRRFRVVGYLMLGCPGSEKKGRWALGVFLAPTMGVGRLELPATGQYGGFAAGRELTEA